MSSVPFEQFFLFNCNLPWKLFTLVTYAILSYSAQNLKDSLQRTRRCNFLFANWLPERYRFSAVLLSSNLLVAFITKVKDSEHNQAML